MIRSRKSKGVETTDSETDSSVLNQQKQRSVPYYKYTGRISAIAICILLILASHRHWKYPTHHHGHDQVKVTKRNRRKFVSYTSCDWERLWLDNVQNWTEEEEICQVFYDHESNRRYMHAFLDLLCTSTILDSTHQDWCVMDDDYRPLFYHTKQNKSVGENYSLFFHSESPFKDMNLTTLLSSTPRPLRPGPEHEDLVSKFVFLDEETGEEYVEYIEPLVSHLRFPLARCLPTKIFPIPYSLFRGYVIPPPEPPRGASAVYFDAGASSWSQGGGGPSLKFFVNVWKRHGIDFQDIFAFEMTTSSDDFYKDVPPQYKNRTHYQQCAVSSLPEGETTENPFIPHVIERYHRDHATRASNSASTNATSPSAENENVIANDLYLFFKLDIDSPLVEAGSVEYIMDIAAQGLIHEFAWEHHVHGNYLMRVPWSGPAGLADLSLKDSYNIFLRLRMMGIRAHSWV
jgi:hypothetical protein